MEGLLPTNAQAAEGSAGAAQRLIEATAPDQEQRDGVDLVVHGFHRPGAASDQQFSGDADGGSENIVNQLQPGAGDETVAGRGSLNVRQPPATTGENLKSEQPVVHAMLTQMFALVTEMRDDQKHLLGRVEQLEQKNMNSGAVEETKTTLDEAKAAAALSRTARSENYKTNHPNMSDTGKDAGVCEAKVGLEAPKESSEADRLIRILERMERSTKRSANENSDSDDGNHSDDDRHHNKGAFAHPTEFPKPEKEMTRTELLHVYQMCMNWASMKRGRVAMSRTARSEYYKTNFPNMSDTVKGAGSEHAHGEASAVAAHAVGATSEPNAYDVVEVVDDDTDESFNEKPAEGAGPAKDAGGGQAHGGASAGAAHAVGATSEQSAYDAVEVAEDDTDESSNGEPAEGAGPAKGAGSDVVADLEMMQVVEALVNSTQFAQGVQRALPQSATTKNDVEFRQNIFMMTTQMVATRNEMRDNQSKMSDYLIQSEEHMFAISVGEAKAAVTPSRTVPLNGNVELTERCTETLNYDLCDSDVSVELTGQGTEVLDDTSLMVKQLIMDDTSAVLPMVKPEDNTVKPLSLDDTSVVPLMVNPEDKTMKQPNLDDMSVAPLMVKPKDKILLADTPALTLPTPSAISMEDKTVVPRDSSGTYAAQAAVLNAKLATLEADTAELVALFAEFDDRAAERTWQRPSPELLAHFPPDFDPGGDGSRNGSADDSKLATHNAHELFCVSTSSASPTTARIGDAVPDFQRLQPVVATIIKLEIHHEVRADDGAFPPDFDPGDHGHHALTTDDHADSNAHRHAQPLFDNPTLLTDILKTESSYTPSSLVISTGLGINVPVRFPRRRGRPPDSRRYAQGHLRSRTSSPRQFPRRPGRPPDSRRYARGHLRSRTSSRRHGHPRVSGKMHISSTSRKRSTRRRKSGSNRSVISFELCRRCDLQPQPAIVSKHGLLVVKFPTVIDQSFIVSSHEAGTTSILAGTLCGGNCKRIPHSNGVNNAAPPEEIQ